MARLCRTLQALPVSHCLEADAVVPSPQLVCPVATFFFFGSLAWLLVTTLLNSFLKVFISSQILDLKCYSKMSTATVAICPIS